VLGEERIKRDFAGYNGSPVVPLTIRTNPSAKASGHLADSAQILTTVVALGKRCKARKKRSVRLVRKRRGGYQCLSIKVQALNADIIKKGEPSVGSPSPVSLRIRRCSAELHEKHGTTERYRFFLFGLKRFAVDCQLSEVEDWLSADYGRRPGSRFRGNVYEIIASKTVIAGETAMMPSLFTDHGPPSMANTFPPASSILIQIPVSWGLLAWHLAHGWAGCLCPGDFV